MSNEPLLKELLLHNLNNLYLTEERERLILDKSKPLGVLDQAELGSVRQEKIFWQHRIKSLEKGLVD